MVMRWEDSGYEEESGYKGVGARTSELYILAQS